ncbi:MAG: hypothetical protein LAP40_06095 [Acidobacteriia bacterium]|nr:hypothetical protein [Terriglobia bacterium]
MNRLGRWLVGQLCRTLDRDERDAVLGDLAETGAAASRALPEVCGLVVRRHASYWRDWRPWLALVGFVLPVGWMLTGASQRLGSGFEYQLWLARNSAFIDQAILHTGASFGPGLLFLASGSMVLLGWAWVSGYVLGALSRRTLAINGTLFCAGLLILAWLEGLPRFHQTVTGTVIPGQRDGFAMVLQIVLVLLPAILGMRQGLQPAPGPLVRALLWVSALAAALAPTGWAWLPPGANWRVQLLLLPIYWPLTYLVATAAWRSRAPRRPDPWARP